jgi:hypothetical protein
MSRERARALASRHWTKGKNGQTCWLPGLELPVAFGTTAFVVELPPGTLSAAAVSRYTHAVLEIAR